MPSDQKSSAKPHGSRGSIFSEFWICCLDCGADQALCCKSRAKAERQATADNWSRMGSGLENGWRCPRCTQLFQLKKGWITAEQFDSMRFA